MRNAFGGAAPRVAMCLFSPREHYEPTKRAGVPGVVIVLAKMVHAEQRKTFGGEAWRGGLGFVFLVGAMNGPMTQRRGPREVFSEN
jgi:hypothetical protein